MSDSVKLAIHRLASSTAPTGVVTGTVGPFSISLSTDATDPVVTGIAAETAIKAGRFDMTLVDETTLADAFWAPYDTDGAGTAESSCVADWDVSEDAQLTFATSPKVSSIANRISGGPTLDQSNDTYRMERVASDANFQNKQVLVPKTDWASSEMGSANPRGYIASAAVNAQFIFAVTQFVDGTDSVFTDYALLVGEDGTSSNRLFGVQGGDVLDVAVTSFIPSAPGTAKKFTNGTDTTATLSTILPLPASVVGFQSDSQRNFVPVVGYYTQPATPNRPWSGPIAEIIILDAVPAQALRERYEGYLAHKWGLEGLLPGAHPYKSAAPEQV